MKIFLSLVVAGALLAQQPVPGVSTTTPDISGYQGQHFWSRFFAPQRNGAPQRAHLSGVGRALCKPGHCLAHEGYLLAEIRAAVADREMHAQLDALGEAELAVEALRYQARHFFARQHHFPNHSFVRHSRNAMRAR